MKGSRTWKKAKAYAKKAWTKAKPYAKKAWTKAKPYAKHMGKAAANAAFQVGKNEAKKYMAGKAGTRHSSGKSMKALTQQAEIVD